jgi:hypothetical protein
MAYFPQASPPTPCAHLYPPPYASYALPISFVSILPPAQYWVRSADHSAPRCKYGCTVLEIIEENKCDDAQSFLRRTTEIILIKCVTEFLLHFCLTNLRSDKYCSRRGLNTYIKPWRQDLRCFGILRIVEWLFLADVLGQWIGPICRGRRSRPLQTGPIRCFETSIKNCRYTARKIAEERRSHLHRG